MQSDQALGAHSTPDWPAIAAVILGVTAFSVAQGVTYPLISLTLEARGVSSTLIGINALGFALGLGLATLMLGRLTNRFRPDRLIIAGLIGCSLCLATFSAFTSMWVWFGARLVLGFSSSLIFMLSEAWLNVACPDRLRGRISGVYGASICGGFAAGPLAIPLLGTSGGLGFALTAVYLALVAFATAILMFSTRTVPEPSSTRDLFRFFRHAPMLAAMVFAFGFADIAAISAMPVYFVKTGHTEAFAAFSVTVLALPTAIAQPFIGVLLDRLPRHRVAVCSACVAALSYLVVPALEHPAAILTAFATMGAATFALYTCALTMLGEKFRGPMLVAGSAAYALAYAVGSGVGSSATGAIMEVGGPQAGPLSVGIALSAFTAAFIFGGRRKES
ncbi:MFS transporter [Sinorhizobium sp. BG8]|uniref:MFS transporter n=1 Tax=Sinorhizobium sp. BG8 TaxID=2613773 RepID=UPI00193CE8F0|nr:MFS transporter [Sinorhizobium sp. BG8]QRM54654.1 MFS transporter [Sinorhizobium sp. BG8]